MKGRWREMTHLRERLPGGRRWLVRWKVSYGQGRDAKHCLLTYRYPVGTTYHEDYRDYQWGEPVECDASGRVLGPWDNSCLRGLHRKSNSTSSKKRGGPRVLW